MGTGELLAQGQLGKMFRGKGVTCNEAAFLQEWGGVGWSGDVAIP